MAFLLRLRTIRTFTTPSPSLSLLHHRYLSSTSNSASGTGDHPNSNHPFLFCLRKIQTLTNPSLSLLDHHHRRLFSTSDDPNSNHPSPSLLRELREAVKSLSVSESPFVSKFHSVSPPPPFPSHRTHPFFPSKKAEQDVLLNPTSSSFSLHVNLQLLRESVLCLKHKQDTDLRRLAELFKSKIASSLENQEISGKILTRSQPNWNEIDELITKTTRYNEIMVEIMELAEMLINSTLTSLYEIFKILYVVRKDLQDNDVWNELYEGLLRVQEVELKNFKLLAEDSNLQLVFFRQRITNLLRMRDNQKG